MALQRKMRKGRRRRSAAKEGASAAAGIWDRVRGGVEWMDRLPVRKQAWIGLAALVALLLAVLVAMGPVRNGAGGGSGLLPWFDKHAAPPQAPAGSGARLHA